MLQFQECIDRLSAWAETRKLYIAKGNFDAYLHSNKHIVYNTALRNKTNMVYSLLHECGHAIAFNDRRSYKHNFPVLFKQRFSEDKVNKRTNRYKMEIVLEEHDAWRRGQRLADKLGLDLDADKYYAYAARWVKTYMDPDAEI